MKISLLIGEILKSRANKEDNKSKRVFKKGFRGPLSLVHSYPSLFAGRKARETKRNEAKRKSTTNTEACETQSETSLPQRKTNSPRTKPSGKKPR